MSATNLKKSSRNFSRYPLLWLSIAFAFGIFIAKDSSLDPIIFIAIILVSGILAFLLSNLYRSIFVLAAFIAVGAFYFHVEKASKPEDALKHLYDSKVLESGDPIEVRGTVEGKPEVSVGGFSIILRANEFLYKGKRFDVSGKVRLFAAFRDDLVRNEYSALALRYGTKISVATNLNREERFLNPGGVSYLEILDQKDIQATGSIKSPLIIEHLGQQNHFSLMGWIHDYRQSLIQKIQANFNVRTSGILIASMLGNRNYLTKETADIFREGGTFHVLVISGLHITFIGGVLLFIVRLFSRKRWIQFLLTSSILWAYSFAVGAEIPVVRAALMFTILLFSFVIYRRGTLLNALGACAFLILLWRPEDLFSQSFHLTFASLVGIIAVAFPLIEKLRSIGGWMPTTETPFPPKVHKKLKTLCETLYWSEKKWQKTLRENVWDCGISKSEYGTWLNERSLQKPLRWIFEGIIVTAVVQVFLLPFLILYFHRLSFGAVLLNLWVGVFVVLQNLSALVAILFSELSSLLGLPFIKFAELLNWFLLTVPQIFIDWNLASVRVPIYTGGMNAVYFLYFLPLLILTFFLNRWNLFGNYKNEKRFPAFPVVGVSSVAFLILFCLIAFHPFSSPKPNGKLTVDFLDVGQGDSMLVTFPNGETMLVDGGGRFDFSELFIEKQDGEKESFDPDVQGVGETVVSEFLWEKGYSKVDYIVSTHPDADHIQGLTPVLKNFRVGKVFVGSGDEKDEEFSEFVQMSRKKHVPIERIYQGDTFEIAGVKVFVLNPSEKNAGTNVSTNDNSVVLKLVYGSREFLLTGDIERKTELEIASGFPALLESDVVKVAHHGSRTSSTEEFVNRTKAEYAIIPVGRKSRFGHPHEEVVKRWKQNGTKVWTTGERGTVTISTDGKSIEVQTFLRTPPE